MFNESVLVKQIKKAAKDRLFWQLTEDNEHYLTNSHWMIKANHFTGKVLAALVESFGKMPQPGQTLCLQFKNVTENTSPDCRKVYYPESATQEGKLTPIVILPSDSKEKTYRMVKIGSDTLFIDNDYAEMIDESTADAKGSGINKPVYIGENFLVLPFRNTGTQFESIKEYLAI